MATTTKDYAEHDWASHQPTIEAADGGEVRVGRYNTLRVGPLVGITVEGVVRPDGNQTKLVQLTAQEAFKLASQLIDSANEVLAQQPRWEEYRRLSKAELDG